VYSTCIFCNRSLGSNTVLERFPVGRRVAFDAAKGRLWVICRRCERWNLTPLDERWEAVEEAERLYRDARQRVATPEIGLARLADGTELVRIGAPLRPEFAGWRYGDQFGRRRNRQMLMTGAVLAATGGVIVGSIATGVSIGGFGWGITQLGKVAVRGRAETIIARVRTEAGIVLPVRRRHLAESRLARTSDGALAIDLRYVHGSRHFEGPEALRVASLVIPAVNREGGSRKLVAAAVARIEHVGGPERFVEKLARGARASTAVPLFSFLNKGTARIGETGLYALPAVDRLSLEMALHEETERRAMAGELEMLERAWRDAEEVAAIADDLLVPMSVRTALERLRGH
jgi:hypothetical protein